VPPKLGTLAPPLSSTPAMLLTLMLAWTSPR
jgi:hypothetical protein